MRNRHRFTHLQAFPIRVYLAHSSKIVLCTLVRHRSYVAWSRVAYLFRSCGSKVAHILIIQLFTSWNDVHRISDFSKNHHDQQQQRITHNRRTQSDLSLLQLSGTAKRWLQIRTSLMRAAGPLPVIRFSRLDDLVIFWFLSYPFFAYSTSTLSLNSVEPTASSCFLNSLAWSLAAGTQ